MNLAPFNKTAILEYMILETFKKVWNLTKSIRKRMKIILKRRIIRIDKYNERALLINGWVSVENFYVEIKSDEELKEGILNYKAETQKHLNALKKANNTLKFCLSLTEPVQPSVIDYARYLLIRHEEIDFYAGLSFDMVDKLEFVRVSVGHIKAFLKRVKKVGKLKLEGGKLQGINLFSLEVDKIELSCLTILGSVILPENLKQLKLLHAFNFQLIKQSGLSELDIDQDINLNDSQLLWIRQISGLKSIILRFDYIRNFFPYLPSSVRSISSCSGLTEQINETGLDSIRKSLPLLFSINDYVGYTAIEKLNLRVISCHMEEDYNGTFSVRPRLIVVSEENCAFLNKHPELFEKVRDVRILCKKFNRSCLPKGLKNRFKVTSIMDKMYGWLIY